MGAGTAGDFGNTKYSNKNAKNSITESSRVGSALKQDSYNNFPNIIDNYAKYAKTFSIKGRDNIVRTLYQIKGSLNGKAGIFEWILDKGKNIVTHRRFIPNGKITGIPNMK